MAVERTNPKPVDVGTVQLPRDLIKTAKKIAAHEGTTMTAVIVGILGPAIDRRWKKTAAAELHAHELGEAGA